MDSDAERNAQGSRRGRLSARRSGGAWKERARFRALAIACSLFAAWGCKAPVAPVPRSLEYAIHSVRDDVVELELVIEGGASFLRAREPASVVSVEVARGGLATYFASILEARMGWVDEGALWEHLLGGFDQAIQPSGGPPIPNEAGSRRTYWGGALFALHLDAAIRAATAGEHGLEDGMKAWLRMPAPTSRLSADDYLREIDRALGLHVALPLLEAARDQRPPFAEGSSCRGWGYRVPVLGSSSFSRARRDSVSCSVIDARGAEHERGKNESGAP